jgi:hypothetical protein
MGEHRLIQPNPEAEVSGRAYWNETDDGRGLLLLFRCPSCTEAGEVRIPEDSNDWPLVICEQTGRRFSVRFEPPSTTIDATEFYLFVCTSSCGNIPHCVRK